MKKKRIKKTLPALIVQLAFITFVTLAFVIQAKFYPITITTGLLSVHLILDYLAGHTEDDDAKNIIYKISDIIMMGAIISFIGIIVYYSIKFFKN